MARLPLEKYHETTELLKKFLHETKIRKRKLDSLIGKLCFATSVVPGRAFLLRLYNKASVTRVPFLFIKISRSMRSDMSTWLHFLSDYNGISFFRHSKLVYSDEINMCSDASLLGFGATYGTQWIQASWPKSWKRFHITVLEFFPIFVLISVFARLLTNSNIFFHCDNQAVVDIINKQTSKNKTVMNILRPLVLIILRNNISLRAQHIPGINNTLCDKISWFQINPDLLRQFGMRPMSTTIPDHL